ncbi:MAG: hypothetical protein ACMUJM_24685 [bacterium]
MKKKSIKILKNADSKEKLKKAVGSLGIFIELTDNSWIAIRYSDIHMPGFPSCAIALDSSNRWFMSTHHFCGRFQAYKGLEKSTRQYIEMCVLLGDEHESFDKKMKEQIEDVYLLVNSENLNEAHNQLLKMTFHEIKIK